LIVASHLIHEKVKMQNGRSGLQMTKKKQGHATELDLTDFLDARENIDTIVATNEIEQCRRRLFRYVLSPNQVSSKQN